MKTRLRCRECGRIGVWGSFTRATRQVFHVRSWIRRRMNAWGRGRCRNLSACTDRAKRQAHRRQVHA